MLAALRAGDAPPLEPLRVCEILENIKDYEGKPVAAVGRYSMRQNGRSMAEEKCTLPLNSDAKVAPRLPETVAINQARLDSKLREVRKTTSLATFRFGSPDYDRWALVYGRIETKPARLLYRGDGEIILLGEK